MFQVERDALTLFDEIASLVEASGVDAVMEERGRSVYMLAPPEGSAVYENLATRVRRGDAGIGAEGGTFAVLVPSGSAERFVEAFSRVMDAYDN